LNERETHYRKATNDASAPRRNRRFSGVNLFRVGLYYRRGIKPGKVQYIASRRNRTYSEACPRTDIMLSKNSANQLPPIPPIFALLSNSPAPMVHHIVSSIMGAVILFGLIFFVAFLLGGDNSDKK
jgi:hypothetical protein